MLAHLVVKSDDESIVELTGRLISRASQPTPGSLTVCPV